MKAALLDGVIDSIYGEGKKLRISFRLTDNGESATRTGSGHI
jgi:hypothetical protein